MKRTDLARRGIQLPVLPAIVLGSLPHVPGANWAGRLAGIGLDVVASGVELDTAETARQAANDVPYRPVWVRGGAAHDVGLAVTDHDVDPSFVVVAVRGRDPVPDPNDVAALVLPRVHANAASWWVAAADLATLEPADAERRLVALVEGVQLVRLYLAKQQFD